MFHMFRKLRNTDSRHQFRLSKFLLELSPQVRRFSLFPSDIPVKSVCSIPVRSPRAEAGARFTCQAVPVCADRCPNLIEEGSQEMKNGKKFLSLTFWAAQIAAWLSGSVHSMPPLLESPAHPGIRPWLRVEELLSSDPPLTMRWAVVAGGKAQFPRGRMEPTLECFWRSSAHTLVGRKASVGASRSPGQQLHEHHRREKRS